ncbi:MAG: hypothetical protein EU535_03240 [Promethearchaeota archaeon]|nr:MAG: hypothetical protein EU535_03240 [Candidatus Lokiarchaeota archaeon]
MSYVIEGPLIFYKSINKTKKILAFSVIQTEEFYPLMQILIEFLNKRFIKYFSVQLRVPDNKKKIFLLNFEEDNKDVIIKFFNIVFQKIAQFKNYLNVLTKEALEAKFLDIFKNKITPNLSILKSDDSILIKNHRSSTIYNFYILNLDRIQTKFSFLHSFLNLASSFNIEGYLILNFKIDRESNVDIMIYFVEIKNDTKFNENIDYKINNFYNNDLITKKSIEIKSFFNLLWRSEILDNGFLFKDFSDLFNINNQYDFDDLIKFNFQFETNLRKKKIKFKRLNKNLFFIENCLLFYFSPILESKVILEILRRYSSQFYIYILIMKDEQYDELLKIEQIEFLKNVVTLNSSKFLKLDFNIFKDLKLE